MSGTLVTIDELEEDRLLENTVMAGMMAIVLVVIALSVFGRMSLSIPALTEGIEPTAANIGRIWHQLNAAGVPNELRMVSENSTGAFESMMVGCTT